LEVSSSVPKEIQVAIIRSLFTSDSLSGPPDSALLFQDQAIEKLERCEQAVGILDAAKVDEELRNLVSSRGNWQTSRACSKSPTSPYPASYANIAPP